MNIEIPTEDGELVCVICYDKIGYLNTEGVQEQPVQLECQHVFGNVCLDSWLAKRSRCPICRTQVDGYASASSSDASDGSRSSDVESSDSGSDEGSDDEMNDSDEDTGREVDDEDGDSDEASDNDSNEQGSQTSEATHISISSDDSEVSAMSIDVGPEHVEDEDMSDDSGDDDNCDTESESESSSQYQPDGMTPQEVLRRLASSTVAGSLMEGIASGRIDMSTFLNQARRRHYMNVEEEGDEQGESD